MVAEHRDPSMQYQLIGRQLAGIEHRLLPDNAGDGGGGGGGP